MEPENMNKPEKKETFRDTAGKWIDKAEGFIDDVSDQVYQSNMYQKTGKAVEKTTLGIFRKAGKWWGKSQQISNKSGEKSGEPET